ncbi:ABC transporter permease [Haladaptatus cibarius]|uniref:ABC transporter permease n=1 Tax=Haladaptatus cibarius TaxID=453847 RepID=UPI000A02EBDC|nr:ABC transporter permease [Haladaptatus cibarius]
MNTHYSTSSHSSWPRQVKSFFVRAIKELFRSRVALFWSIGWPIGWYFLTMALFIEVPEQVPADQVETVLSSIKASNAISFGIFGAFTVSLVTFANNFTDDLEAKRYRKLRSLPVSPSADLTGRFLAGTLLGAVSFCSVLVAGYLHGASFNPRSSMSIPITAVALFLFCIIGMSIAVLLAVVVQKGEYLTAISNTVLMILYFITGFNGASPRMIPEGNRWIVNVLPNSLATRMQMYYMTDFSVEGTGLTPPPVPNGIEHFALLTGYAIVLWLGSVLVMRRMMYYGEGGE